MIPEKISVQEIFSRERQFVVPLFQRSYVWSRDTQWEPLWQDVLSRADAHLKRSKADYEGKLRSHFLGAIVLNVASIQGRSVATCDVIDGQQRLTTLQLMLAALRDLSHEYGADKKDAQLFTRLTRNPDCDDDSNELFKVWPTNSDRDIYRSVMTAGSHDAVRKLADNDGNIPRIAQSYLYFSEQIRSFVQLGDGVFGVKERFFALRNALSESLQLVVIELEEGDDPQIIFETLNARGQPLLASDLIRNHVFMRLPPKEVDVLYDKFWRHFDSERAEHANDDGEGRFWHIETRQGRLVRPRIDLFIFHYLTMKTEDDIRIGQLFKEYRNWRDDNKLITNEAFLADLKSYSYFFRTLTNPIGDSRVEVFARRLLSLDTSTVYPILLFLMNLSDDILSDSDLDRCIGDLESFMVRRFICDLSANNYNRFFLSLLSKVKSAWLEKQDIATALRAELLSGDAETTKWPTNEEFSAGWQWKKLYVKSRPDRSAMILKALNSAMTTSKNESYKLIDRDLSVEHLLPQSSPMEFYPYGGYQGDDGYTVEEYRNYVMNTIGNLTLLTKPLNSSVSNGPISDKAIDIVDESDLRINAWMRKSPPVKWDEDDIWQRSSLLFEIAKTVWPRP